MKKMLLILTLLVLKATPSVCQGCKTYDCAIQTAEKLLDASTAKDKYEKILSNLNDAEDYAANDTHKKDKIRDLRKGYLLQ